MHGTQITSGSRDAGSLVLAAHQGCAQPHRRPASEPCTDDGLLTVEDVHVRFGGVAALAGARLRVAEGEICGVIGPNGAGKTTLFNCISGLTRIDTGRIGFDGLRLDGVAPHLIARRGISRTFQNLGLYHGMTVLENVLLGGHIVAKGGFWSAALRIRSIGRDERSLRDAGISVLDQLGLAPIHNKPVGSLPYATMKRVELARALMSHPRLLLLDEPAGGLTHGEVVEFAALIRELRTRHRLTIMLVEHHMKLVMGLCDHVVVLHLGEALADGKPESVRRNPDVIAAYLGVGA